MGFLSRFKTSSTEVAPAAVAGMRVQAGARAASVAVAEPAFAPRATRSSNCLKDFLWHLNGIGRGTLLDLGPVWQSTVTFFGERGFKVFTEDILSGLNRFTREAETANLTLSMDEQRPSKSQLARKFLESTLQYGPRSFDAVLAWDLWDYMDDETSAGIRQAFVPAARWRRDPGNFSQQTSRTISQVPRSGRIHNGADPRSVARAIRQGFSKSRDDGTVWQVPLVEDISRPRSSERSAFCKVRLLLCDAGFHLKLPTAISDLISRDRFFACPCSITSFLVALRQFGYSQALKTRLLRSS